MQIDSPANPRVKALVRHQRRRDDTCILIEGLREVTRALDAGHPIHELYLCETFLPDDARAELESRAGELGIEVVRLGRNAFDKASYRQSPDGVLALGAPFSGTFDDFDLPGHPLLLVADRIEKPGNLGAMLRSLSGAGATGLICCDGVTELGNPNVIRASMGAVFEVPCVAASFAETLAWLRARGLTILVADPDGPQPYWDADLTGGAAIVVGAEAHGLSAAWQQAADIRVAIPMHGQADSLNAATAATLLLYEACRQRWGHHPGS